MRNPAALLAAAEFDPAISVDGLVPGGVVHPESGEEVAALLAMCDQHKFTATPVGGGTKLALGNVPPKMDVAVSTLGLGGVRAYEPTDLVCSLGAGARFGDVQAVLAEHGQTIPLDAPDDATIGGLVATAIAGPRRLGSGSLRDLLIGIEVAHPSGTVTHGGGMVVKNVSGFDMPRVYHGSLGTLGIIVSANFKVLPLPQRETTVVGTHQRLDEALAAARRIRQSRIMPLALEVSRFGDGWSTAVRIGGHEATLDGAVLEVQRLLGHDPQLIEGLESSAWWRGYISATDLRLEHDAALIRLSVRPKDVDTMAEGAVGALSQLGIASPVVAISPGLGQVIIRLEPEPADARDRFLTARDVLSALADHAVVLAAPPAWKRGIDVWGPAPATLPVMKALKEQFDPGGVLNAGRFVGFI